MKKPIIALMLLLCAGSPALAVEVKCTDRPECWPDGSAMRSALIAAEAKRKAEQRLAQAHHRLVELLAATTIEGRELGNDRLINALRSQHAAWLKYRTEECELVGSLTGAGGAWPSAFAVRCEENHVVRRLRRVQAATRCIERIPADRRFMDQNTCLQQLAPLTNILQ